MSDSDINSDNTEANSDSTDMNASIPEVNTAAPVTPEPGRELKKAREAAGVSLQYISEATLISAARLDALESGKYSEVGSPAYITGYARAYAKAIGYDASHLIDAFEQAVGFDRQRSSQMHMELAKEQVPAATNQSLLFGMLVTGCALLVIVIILFVVYLSSGPSADTEMLEPLPATPKPVHKVEPENIAHVELKPEPDRVRLVLGDTSRSSSNLDRQAEGVDLNNNEATSNSSNESKEPSVDSKRPQLEVAHTDTHQAILSSQSSVSSQSTQSSQPLSSIEPSTLIQAEVAARVSTEFLGSEPIQTVDINLPDTESAVVDTGELSINFSEDCWIRVIDASGKRLADNVKKAGQAVRLKGVPPFFIKLGNAEAASIKFNGDSIPVIPRPGFRTLELSVGH